MIDWAHVAMLRDEVGKDDFDDIVILFIEEVDGFVARLAEHVNLETLGDDLHFVKGSAASLGFRGFVEHCLAGERLCQGGNPEQVDVPAILTSYADCKRLFLEEMTTKLAS